MTNGAFYIGEWLVEPQLGQLTHKKKTARIEPQVMKVLCHLAVRQGEVVSKQELIDTLWGARCTSDAALARCISCIRVSLDDSRQNPKFIQTVPKVGYRCVAAISQVAAQTDGRDFAFWKKAGIAATGVLFTFVLVSFAKPENPKSLIVSNVVLANQNQKTNEDRSIRASRNIASSWLERNLSGLKDQVVISKQSDDPGNRATGNGSHFLKSEIDYTDGSAELRFVLSSTVDDNVIWQKRFSLDETTVFAATENVVRSVSETLDVPLPNSVAKQNSRPPTFNVLAYDAYLDGIELLHQFNKSSNHRASRYFEYAIEKDPKFALAYAGLSITLTMENRFWRGDRELEARQAAENALRFDPEHAETNYAMAEVLMSTTKLDQALHHFQVAIEKDPMHAMANVSSALLFADQGDYETAEQHLLRAIEINPPDHYPMNLLGSMYYGIGDLDNAKYWLSRGAQGFSQNRRTIAQLAVLDILDHDVDNAVLRCDQINIADQSDYACARISVSAIFISGDYDAALRRIEEMSEIWPDDDGTILTKAQILLSMNDAETAVELVNGVIEPLRADAAANSCDTRCYWIIGTGLGLKGELAEAFTFLERASELGRGNLIWDKVDPLLNPVRQDARFENLMASTDDSVGSFAKNKKNPGENAGAL